MWGKSMMSCGSTSPEAVEFSTLRLDLGFELLCGAQDFAIYEGTIGIWYSHGLYAACPEALLAFTEQITPWVGNRYYLVVPINTCKGVEGSYGSCSPGACGFGDDRVVGAPACATAHTVPTAPPCPQHARLGLDGAFHAVTEARTSD